MEYDQKVVIRFLCKERVSPEVSAHVSRHSSKAPFTASGASGGGVSMLGKNAKAFVTSCDPAGHQLSFLISEF
jgi:hypothetical protein